MSLFWVQLIGFVAFLIEISSVQWPRRRQILLSQVVANIFWTIHFLLLGATSGAAMTVVGAIRSYVFIVVGDNNRSRYIPGVIIALVLVAGLASWSGWASLLAIAGMAVAVVAQWQQNEQHLRILMCVAAPLWFSYNLLNGSYPGMVNEMLLMMSSIVAFWRYKRHVQLIEA